MWYYDYGKKYIVYDEIIEYVEKNFFNYFNIPTYILLDQ